MKKRSNQAGFTLVEMMAALLSLCMLALFVGFIYTIIHFIIKFW